MFALSSFIGFSQQDIDVSIVYDSETGQFQVRQDIVFKNTTAKPLSSIVLNDWNNAYSDKKSHLGRRFSDEFIRSFHLSREKERGYTKIENVSINSADAGWNRIYGQIDLLEIPLKEKLNPGNSVQLHLEYILKFPDSKFTRYGDDKGNFYLKDFLLSAARINENGEFVTYSNENIDDACYEKINFLSLKIQLPSDYGTVTSNLSLASQNKEGSNEWHFEGKKLHEIQLAIEKNKTFEVYKNDKAEVETNLYGPRVTDYQKAIIIDRVINFTEERLGKSITSKYLISQTEYDRNPFYGLNQLPGFLSPFPNSFLYELKFLKIYTANYLKQNLNIDFRKDHHIYDAIQTFTIIRYIKEHYPDLKLLGGLSQFKVLKGYQIAKADFNDQYYLLYMLMARKNLDQSLMESKENLVKFNEQISNRYKAGISYLYLNKYLRNNGISDSFLKHTELNRSQKTNLSDFKKVLNQNVGTSIPWFFDNVITTGKEIDFTFGEIQKEKDDLKIEIQNKTNLNVPFSITGFKKRKKLFENWYPPTQIDTTVIIQNTEADKLIINYKNEVPEINNRDNYKSLKGFLSLNKPIKFSFLKDIENPAYNQIYYFPEVGFNVYDGAIISLKFNNKSLIEKPFSFSLAPSLSTNTASVTGFGIVNYTQQRKNSDLYQIKYSLAGAYYHYIQDASYLRITPLVLFKFRNNDNLRDNFWQTLSLRQVIVTKEDSPLVSDNLNPLNYSVFDLRYGLGDGETAKTYSLLGNMQLSGQFGKLTFESLYRKLFENNYQFGLRLYAGTFLYKNTNTDYFNFALDRPKDYLFDYEYYGRSENTGLFSQQIIIAEGGFKSKFSNPYANQWMTTLNATSSIWKWIQMYGDAGIYKNKGIHTKFVYDSGIQFSLVPDYFELFFPVYSSNGFELSQKNYNEKIRFMITLNPKTLINLFTRKWF
ncbi:aminopeptidase [Flavobacterium amniphilum]|uniref:aminopeptidase n=1 Tax=Flavobacterium amniphilum TaxID=1834035 RepID=UPI00202A87D9|nr:aminopeptidase [Flavobacterium amniphilum]MCL9805274.1 aminopeptidase [Flavobacterium amniphilum]